VLVQREALTACAIELNLYYTSNEGDCAMSTDVQEPKRLSEPNVPESDAKRQSALEVLARASVDRPDDIMFTFLDTGEDVTIGQLHERVVQWAGSLMALGVAEGDPVAVMLPTSAQAYYAWLGTAWMKALQVGINVAQRGSMLTHVLNSAGARVAIVSHDLVYTIADVADALTCLDTVVVLGGQPDSGLPFRALSESEFLAGAVDASDLTPPGWDDISAVVYTSGTTGPSKGVLVPWASVHSNHCTYQTLGRDDRFYTTWPVFHLSGMMPFTVMITCGGRTFVRSKFSVSGYWDDIRASGATLTVLLAGLTNYLWSQPERPDDRENPLRQMTMAPVIPQFKEFEKRFGLVIHTAWAMSEIGAVTSLYYPMPNHRSCGRPNPDYELRIVDSEGNDVGPEVVGEALVRCRDRSKMSPGYLNMPEKTAESWVGGWFHTGDGLKYDDDGNYYYADRLKDSIRRKGENISSFEVENEINAHPEVLESAAVAIRDAAQMDEEVMVLVVRHKNARVTEGELWEFMAARCPAYMVPRYIEFIADLPKTHSGRTRKIELRERGVTTTTWDCATQPAG
jgi:carnitine-CoA ligase